MTSMQSAFDSLTVDAASDARTSEDAEAHAAVEEFAAVTTDVTQVEAIGDPRPPVRRPEDAEAERISLRRVSGQGRGEAQFSGREAWHLADLMLMAWAPKRGTAQIEFAIRFGDGELYRGRISLPAGRRRHSLTAHCRRSDTFRASFCPDLTEKQAAALHRVFLSCYRIGRTTDA